MISGEEEARLIYQGVAHTTGGADQRLVVDIGGASTELVTGTGAQTTSLFSLSMGCVTWLERYFADRSLTKENFDLAEAAARGTTARRRCAALSRMESVRWRLRHRSGSAGNYDGAGDG